MSVEIKAEAKRVIISGSLKPIKSFVKEYYLKEIDELGLTDCTVYESVPADDINEMPQYAELSFGKDTIAELGQHLQILYLSQDSAEFAAEIIKGTIPGTIYNYLSKGIGLENIDLYFEYYPVEL